MTTPPHDPYNPNSGGFPQQPYQQPYGQPGYIPVVATTPALPPNNGMAITSMVLSLVGIVTVCAWIGFVLGILGVIFGHVAQGQIKRDGTRGAGMAVAGLVVGYCVIGLLVLVLALPFLITGFAVPLLGAN
ncbi:DUF4190 domain-containing protein [Saccharopolyspora sp. NPDC000359]|uniref:DUF4190 domain-containing protein n=1 Tax=Saccharopolyspora sp. NPDC000359 TaxID=3154251 RepID=UPI00332E5299